MGTVRTLPVYAYRDLRVSQSGRMNQPEVEQSYSPITVTRGPRGTLPVHAAVRAQSTQTPASHPTISPCQQGQVHPQSLMRVRIGAQIKNRKWEKLRTVRFLSTESWKEPHSHLVPSGTTKPSTGAQPLLSAFLPGLFDAPCRPMQWTPSVSWSVCLSPCLPVFLPVCLPACLSICLSVFYCLSISVLQCWGRKLRALHF